ncbi:UDP-N-acetylmuramoylalanine--D-glutamate ligase [Usitatibacter rugosus]|uniref:UDP-N-acetylmuramoylalanine--D-glutamate ligase n=1 Tax=Usitatibacter rugosus TaxID=2732067 RepID=A0A6M4GVE7_9PROT|nr:UDP-N-acetylmuramoyl-L-alanine--D-glutamate ligase [Usitatibacter rugosus]QJR09627.1 UDP-N-acetylmuramoylalanine--D-glutamate ligase [Usitatibacter rugosus]
MSDDWKGRQVLVLGLGDSGLSTLRWLAKRGALLRAADSRASPPALGKIREEQAGLRLDLGAFAPALLEGVDTIVASPGIALREPILREAAQRGIEIVGDIEIFARELRGKGNARVIGVTGTNGKSTVTALACEMARAASLRAQAVGNIGLPVLDALEAAESQPVDVWAVELSSYQLETTSHLACDAATVLNVTQDHLDRYESMAHYAAAKARIFRSCRTRVVNRDDPVTLAMSERTSSTFTFGLGVPENDTEWGLDEARRAVRRGKRELFALDEVAIPGLHNAMNAMAAHALGTAIGLPEDAMAQAIRDFRGLPHRVQLVAETGGVRFYDDSKGTNVGASVAALEGFTQPVVLIAGGDGKGQDFSPLAPAVKARARAVVLIGRDSEAIAKALAGTGVTLERASSMEQAVRTAHALAKPGDAVLLSPACASLDMFRNYGHRGEVFAAAARAVVEGVR